MVTYQVGTAIGFNFVFIILGLIAILTAKVKVLPWILYGLGLALTLLPMMGNGGGGPAIILIFLIIAVFVPVLIHKRKNKAAEKKTEASVSAAAAIEEPENSELQELVKEGVISREELEE